MRILKTIVVPAKMEHLRACLHLVSLCAKQQGFDEKTIGRIELATEEALVNVFNYAYSDGSGDVELSFMLDEDCAFIVEISDCGVPFNILTVVDPDCALDVDHRSIGGLGIFMIKQFTDKLEYRRAEGKNIVRFTCNGTENRKSDAGS